MNRSEKTALAAALRKVLGELAAAPAKATLMGEEQEAADRAKYPGSSIDAKYPVAFGSLTASVEYAVGRVEAIIATSLDRGRGRK